MNRWTGLIFANQQSTLLGLPHGSGDKWALIERDVMIVQNCGSCNYKGLPLLSVQAATATRWDGTGWLFVEAAGAASDTGAAAWAAAQPAWGGWAQQQCIPVHPPPGCHTCVRPTAVSPLPCKARAPEYGLTSVNRTCPPILTNLSACDIPWSAQYSPLVIVVGEQGNRSGQFADLEAFSVAVAAAPLSVTQREVRLCWGNRTLQFFPSNGTHDGYRLPAVDNRAVDVAPAFMYQGPHLNAGLNTTLVRAGYAGYMLEYDFSRDEIRRLR